MQQKYVFVEVIRRGQNPQVKVARMAAYFDLTWALFRKPYDYKTFDEDDCRFVLEMAIELKGSDSVGAKYSDNNIEEMAKALKAIAECKRNL